MCPRSVLSPPQRMVHQYGWMVTYSYTSMDRWSHILRAWFIVWVDACPSRLGQLNCHLGIRLYFVAGISKAVNALTLFFSLEEDLESCQCNSPVFPSRCTSFQHSIKLPIRWSHFISKFFLLTQWNMLPVSCKESLVVSL